jgi:methylenetetrahydrofolate reductase (NADPH)
MQDDPFRNKLARRAFVLTAEVTPPVAADPEALLARARPLKGLADAVNVTDGASARAHMGALAAATILQQDGIAPILQITCRDRNRIAIQGDILGAAALGIRNFLIMTGDDPKAGDQPETKPVFDLNSGQVMAMLRDMRDSRALPSGRKIEGMGLADALIGAADMPFDPPAEWQPKGLAAKIDAGARFAQTQFCMDTQVLRRYAQRLADHGITERIALIVGVIPLKSAKAAAWITQHLYGAIIPEAIVHRMQQARDPEAEGRRICGEVIAELRTIPGIAGAHLMAPGNLDGIVAVLAAARKWGQSPFSGAEQASS